VASRFWFLVRNFFGNRLGPTHGHSLRNSDTRKVRLAASHCEGSKSPRQGESRIKLCPIDRRDYPPIAPAHRQDQTWRMHKEPPLEIEPDEKLRWLRRLDGTRRWQFLDDRRCCRCCGKLFTGRQIEIVGGTRPHGPLRLTCPTRNCSSTPADWLYLHETPGRVWQPLDLPIPTVTRVVRKKRAGRRNGSQPDGARSYLTTTKSLCALRTERIGGRMHSFSALS
jgi:hypothetical protein